MSDKKLRCRKIGASDLDTIADLLTAGFPRRSRDYWVRALGILSRRPTSEGYPQYGYMLESGARAVGVILVIVSRTRGTRAIRCNGSSWYVAPEFRGYASLLVAQTLKHPATHTNISPSAHTLQTIEILGYERYCEGAFAGIPAVAAANCKARFFPVTGKADPGCSIPEEDLELLRDHNSFGCISLWCETEDGGYPFVFRKRYVKGLPLVTGAQLVYGATLDQFVRLARPIGRYLAVRGIPYVLVPANSAIRGLAGKFFGGKQMYYRGPDKPEPTDLAYTEAAMFGI